MWTSADTARDEYQKALVKLIKDNANRIADGADVDIEVNGFPCSKACKILNELIDEADRESS